MRHTNFFRGLFILLLGTFIPLLSGIDSYTYTRSGTLDTHIYFTLAFLFNWGVCWYVVRNLRRHYHLYNYPFLKILLLCLTTSGITGALLTLEGWCWFLQKDLPVSWYPIELAMGMSMLAAILFTLVFEVAYLSYEKAADIRTVDDLDRRRQEAEMHALKNELDPHFMFNSLNTLSHLILSDKDKAVQYNNKLGQVYKYLLVNKDKDLVPLQKELDFIHDYFHLLQLRHQDKLTMEIRVEGLDVWTSMIVPCALQIAVENVIKHNILSEKEPLPILILAGKNAIRVINPLRPRQYSVPSTHIGLKNLDSRCQLVTHDKIEVRQSATEFVLTLPLTTI